MDNPFDEMRKAVANARAVLRAVEPVSNDMAQLLRGNLRHCQSWNLAALKRELRDFNIHTGKWRNQ